MNKEQFQQEAINNINKLRAFINNGQITILNQTYTVVNISKFSITVKGARNGKYTITTSVNSSVMEATNSPVYCIVSANLGNSKDFTIYNNEILELVDLF